ncbi:MAG: Peptidase serralysin terminal [Thermoleophilaceae bacterium]|nr:Peptidase serralysin terminal [Thermoleophilaceae bacterium]
MRRSLMPAVLAALVVAAASAAPASAGTLSMNERAIDYTASPGEQNNVRLDVAETTFFVADGAGVQAPAECHAERGGWLCPRPRSLDSVVIKLGDGDDRFAGGRNVLDPLAYSVSGGPGDDALSAGESGVSLLGEGGNDVLRGGPGDDSLSGRDGNDRVSGGDGADDVLGGRGKDTLSGGPGRDYLDAEDFGGAPERDRVRCGPGTDDANLEALDADAEGARRSPDVVTDDCERVRVGLMGGAVDLLDPSVRAGRLRLYIPCSTGIGLLPCHSRAAARTPDGCLVGSDRRQIPAETAALVGLEPHTAFGRRVYARSQPYTLRIGLSVGRGQSTAFALRVDPRVGRTSG